MRRSTPCGCSVRRELNVPHHPGWPAFCSARSAGSEGRQRLPARFDLLASISGLVNDGVRSSRRRAVRDGAQAKKTGPEKPFDGACGDGHLPSRKSRSALSPPRPAPRMMTKDDKWRQMLTVCPAESEIVIYNQKDRSRNLGKTAADRGQNSRKRVLRGVFAKHLARPGMLLRPRASARVGQNSLSAYSAGCFLFRGVATRLPGEAASHESAVALWNALKGLWRRIGSIRVDSGGAASACAQALGSDQEIATLRTTPSGSEQCCA
jgi:hypothetical protein